MVIAAGEFKAKCLELMERVKRNHEEIVITKYGKPVAKLVACQERPVKSIFGCMKGTAIEIGDITAPLDVEWEALSDNPHE